jgi:hypothetical protein
MKDILLGLISCLFFDMVIFFDEGRLQKQELRNVVSLPEEMLSIITEALLQLTHRK